MFFCSLIGWTLAGVISGLAVGGIVTGLRVVMNKIKTSPDRINSRRELEQAKVLLGEAEFLPEMSAIPITKIRECLERVKV